jgi:thioredoxin 1
MALELNNINFEVEVLKSDIPVLVDFWAPWCGPCKSIAPVLEELAKEFDGKVKIAKVNVDNNQSLAREYQVMSIPNLVFFKEGKKVDQLIGFLPKPELAKKLNAIAE